MGGDGYFDETIYFATLDGREAVSTVNLATHEIQTLSPMQRESTMTFDPASFLVTRVEQPGLNPITYTYDLGEQNPDAINGQIKTVSMGTRGLEFDYNPDGRLHSVTDAANQSVIYTYDAVGRVKTIASPGNQLIQFLYDDAGRMTVLTTPKDIDHTFGWNNVDLNDEYVTPLSGSYTYEYDRDRRLKTIVYPSGAQVVYTYANGLLELINLPGSEPDVDLVYGDGECPDKLTSVTRGTEGVSMAYDGPVVTQITLSGVLDGTLSFDYDNVYNNNFMLDSFTYAGGTENYLYDDDGLLTDAGLFTIARESSTGRPLSISDGVVSLVPGFNDYGEVDSLDYNFQTVPTFWWDLTFDPYSAEITAKSETVAGTLPISYAYTYTDPGQLDTVTMNGAAFEDYDYDDNGNRTYQKINGTERWLDYDNEDRLDKIYSDVAKTVQVANYNYDVDGFLTNKIDSAGTTTYDYSSGGELLGVVFPSGTIQEVAYDHDALGRRVAKRVKQGGNWNTVEKYLWAGMNQGLLAVYDGSDNLVMRFEYADGRLPIAMTYNSATYYLAYDQVGSLRAIFDASGIKVKEITYDSFGNILSEWGSLAVTLPLGFAGGLHDRTTGLVRFGFRDFDPKVGRWTAKDPIGFAGGDVNLYGYVIANPISIVDSSGLDFSSVLDWVQNGLAVAGFFPGVGIVPDVIDLGINVARGQWADAGVSAVAMVPVLGAVGRGADFANDARKALKTCPIQALPAPKIHGHHIFSQRADLRLEFETRGIDIDEFIQSIPENTHRRIHTGDGRGGEWNQAWRDYFGGNWGRYPYFGGKLGTLPIFWKDEAPN